MNNDEGSDPTSSEQKMRHALEARRGTPFSEEEWQEAKRNLVGLFLMLGLEDTPPPDDEGVS